MSIQPGLQLGGYEILALIGRGGMGEVYRARDVKLGRDVALKILPPIFTIDPERLARFRREAQVLAALNHPNIAAIYGFEEAGGTHFLVLELVEGENLQQRLARGPLPLDETLRIARQIGEALEAAHDAGIVHRDLKPANVALTAEGLVKVLDFGLAKRSESSGELAPGTAQSATITSPAMLTGMGVVLGTAAYMAPEQAKGYAADRRSDVWSFGCVLYEMLTGSRAFGGDDVSDTLAAVLRGEPDWTLLSRTVPADVRTVIARCLAKDRRQRFATMSVPLFLLIEPRAAEAVVSRSRPAWAHATVIAATVALAIAGTAAVAWWLKTPVPPPIVTRFEIPLGEGRQFTNAGRQQVAISPDGARVAFVASQRLFVRAMSDSTPVAIAGQETAQDSVTNPTFSPDGQSLVFWATGEEALKRVPVSGGAALTLCHADNPYGISWHGNVIYFGQGAAGILRVAATGGTPEQVVTVRGGERAHGPQLLPDGDHLLFTLAKAGPATSWDSAEIVVQSLETGTRTTVIAGGADARYIPTGHLLYAVSGVVFAVSFDARRLAVTGPPMPVLQGVYRSLNGITGTAHFDVSQTGSLVYVPGPLSAVGGGPTDVAYFDREGHTQPLGLPPARYEYPRVSADGKQLAVGVDDGKDAGIWIYGLSGASAPRRLTFGGRNRVPVWLADGVRVAFQSDRDGDLAVFAQRADGAGVAERLTRPARGIAHVPQSASPDGRHLLFTVSQDGNISLAVLSLQDRTVAPYGDVKTTVEPAATFSPDGNFVAYDAGRGVFVQPFPATGATYELLPGIHPVWARDGKSLFASIPGAFVSVSIGTRPTLTFGNLVRMPLPFLERGPAAERNADVLPDGRRFIGIFVARGTGAPHVEVVEHWFEELKARLHED